MIPSKEEEEKKANEVEADEEAEDELVTRGYQRGSLDLAATDPGRRLHRPVVHASVDRVAHPEDALANTLRLAGRVFVAVDSFVEVLR